MPPSDKVSVKLVVAGNVVALGVNVRLSKARVASFTEPTKELEYSVPLPVLSSLIDTIMKAFVLSSLMMADANGLMVPP